MKQIGLVEIHPFRQEWCSIPENEVFNIGEAVVLRDFEGEEFGKIKIIVSGNDTKNFIVRKATPDDINRKNELDHEAKRSFALFTKLLGQFDLKIKAIDAHYRFDKSKICFYIYSEMHQDFRTFHRAVAAALGRRVAIKNVGLRECAKFFGGLGPCGNELCCRTFLIEIKPVHLRMARQQNLFVEPNKISGYCGKLCCCLRFEEEIYNEALTTYPQIGAMVETKQGRGKVLGIDIFNRKVLIKINEDTELYIPLKEIIHPPRYKSTD
uniref:PSP1 C-terminal domain-containing protein n=1 Tax=candidate division WOR-3 bacterium TaxID=2052148 RepID=A0A7C6EAT1_UNCW3